MEIIAMAADDATT